MPLLYALLNLVGLAGGMALPAWLGGRQQKALAEIQAKSIAEQGALAAGQMAEQRKAQAILSERLSAQETKARERMMALHQQRRSEGMADQLQLAMIQSLLGGQQAGVASPQMQQLNATQSGLATSLAGL